MSCHKLVQLGLNPTGLFTNLRAQQNPAFKEHATAERVTATGHHTSRQRHDFIHENFCLKVSHKKSRRGSPAPPPPPSFTWATRGPSRRPAGCRTARWAAAGWRCWSRRSSAPGWRWCPWGRPPRGGRQTSRPRTRPAGPPSPRACRSASGTWTSPWETERDRLAMTEQGCQIGLDE